MPTHTDPQVSGASRREWRNAHHPTTPGPWADEPDKVQWVDEATGLDCLIVRNRLGALCGYVGLPPGHPWHGLSYSDHVPGGCDDPECPAWSYGHSIDARVEVHGGLTFANACAPDHHDDPAAGICHVPEMGRPADVWWLGFDCAHYLDVTPSDSFRDAGAEYRTVGYVTAECASLAQQLAEVSA